MKYVDIHAHSTFSFLDGCNDPADIATRAAEVGRTSHAITDHGNVSAHVRWEKAALKAGIKPIFGLEAYFTPSVEADREAKRRYNSHMTILAENATGYRNLLAMVTESSRDGFYYRALVDADNVDRHKEGLIFTSGCLSSMMSRVIQADDGDITRAIRLAEDWRDRVGAGNYYLETQMFTLDKTQMVNAAVQRIAAATGIPLIVTNDVHMLDGSQPQRDNRRLLHCIRDRRDWDDPNDEFTYEDEYILSEEELTAHLAETNLTEPYPAMLANIVDISDRCNVTLPKSSFIVFPLPEGATKEQYFYAQIKEGAAFRGIDTANPAYRERLLYEAGLIEEKGFIDYFLVVSDMVRWAKDQGILVGHARGSSAGSLISWLLRITEIDPLRYGLMFERFINVTRTDLPDIDMDFDMERRHEVKQYLAERYGRDRVQTLGTFTSWKGKNALDAVGKAFHVPVGDVAAVKELLIERSSADERASFTVDDTFNMWPRAADVANRYPDIRRAALLESQMKGFSTHACGMLLSSVPFNEVCATYFNKGEGDGISSVDSKDAKDVGLLKMDILGLKTLTVIKEVIDAVGMTVEEVYNLPQDDDLTFEGFRREDIMGIFQFEGGAMRSLLAQFPGISDFMELAHIGALARPGPLYGGMTNLFVKCRNNEMEPTTIHPSVDALLEYTYGQVVYQEQILSIAKDVGHLSWEENNDLREAMAKKYGTEYFNRLGVKFIRQAVDMSGLTQEAAAKIWESMCQFGAWAFNLSHSVSYAHISYVAMYLKQHYPRQFYAAICAHEADADRLKMYLLEFQRKGGKVLAPHINKSAVRWTADSEYPGLAIRGGLSAIDGIGEVIAQRIVEHQPYSGKEQLEGLRISQPTMVNPARVALVANKAVIKALVDVGAFNDDVEQEGDDFLGLKALKSALDSCQVQHKIGAIAHSDEGIMLVAGVVKHRNLRSIYEAKAGGGPQPTRENTKDPDLEHFALIHVEDDTGIIICRVNRYQYHKFRKLLFEDISIGDIVIVEGGKSAGWRNINVFDISLAYKNVDKKWVHVEDIKAAEQEAREIRQEARG